MRTVYYFALFAIMASSAFAATNIVTPSDSSWGAVIEGGTGSAIIATAPTSSFGDAAVRLDGDTSASGIYWGSQKYLGTRLDTLTRLAYSTYVTSPAPSEFVAPSFQINVDYDLTDNITNWQGRLVFEPYQSGLTVTPDSWQTWETLEGVWWSTGLPGRDECPQSSPCTTEELLDAFPNAGVHATLGAIGVKVGSGWTGPYTMYVDGITVNDDVYDFELVEPVPTRAEVLAEKGVPGKGIATAPGLQKERPNGRFAGRK